jgi:lactonase family protein with 7-bladed beta-propeller
MKDNSSGPNKNRQEASHPHSVVFDPTGHFIAAADLGIDKVRSSASPTAVSRGSARRRGRPVPDRVVSHSTWAASLYVRIPGEVARESAMMSPTIPI